MTPYADFLYFGILLYIALPTLLIRRWLGFSRAWVLLATAAMLIVQYGTIAHLLPLTSPEGAGVTREFSASGGLAEIRVVWVVLACGIFQWIVAQAFLWTRTLTKTTAIQSATTERSFMNGKPRIAAASRNDGATWTGKGPRRKRSTERAV